MPCRLPPSYLNNNHEQNVNNNHKNTTKIKHKNKTFNANNVIINYYNHAEIRTKLKFQKLNDKIKLLF